MMIETGLKASSEPADKRWSHPPKKKWIHCYFTVGEEKSEPPNRLKPEVEIETLKNSPIQTYHQKQHLTQLSSPNLIPGDATVQIKQEIPQSSPHRPIPSPYSPARIEARQLPVSPTPAYYDRTSPRPMTASPVQVRPREERHHQRKPQQYSPPTARNSSSPSSNGTRNEVLSHPNNVLTRTAINFCGVTASLTHTTTTTTSSLNATEAVSSLGLVSAFRGTTSENATTYMARQLPVETSLARFSGPTETLQTHLNGITRPNGTNKTLTLPLSISPDFDESLFKEDPNKKRSGTTPSREVHNKLEKNRRAHLKECFETLRKQLPSMDDKKISNQTILKAAHRHIQTLKRREREYEHEMERLAREKIANQQCLATLKKELSARWDHIDFPSIMPDMASIEQQKDKETKSTTTASEQPDLDESPDQMTVSSVSGENQPYTLTNVNSLGITTVKTEPNTIGLAVPREPYQDLNQPLNLSTSPVEHRRSPRRLPSPVQSPKHISNGEWSTNIIPPGVVYSHRVDDSWQNHTGSISIHAQTTNTTAHVVPTTSLTSRVWPTSTTVVRTIPAANVSRSSPIIGEAVVRSPPIANTMPARAIQTTLPGNIGAFPTVTARPVRTTTPSGTTPFADGTPRHALPIVNAGGLVPTHLVANGVQLNGNPGGILGQPAIQVIPPEGYKLLPADHSPNGAKPLTITLAHTDGLERGFGEEGKTGPVMVTVNKNGLSALHLAVPTSARSIGHSQGNGSSCPVTSVPLNLTVSGSSPPAVKMSQAGATSLVQSYVPVAHPNGFTHLVQGMSLVGPLIQVSQAQRGGVVPAGNVVSVSTGVPASKALKTGPAGTTAVPVPLVPAQYANTLAGGPIGGLVNSVVVVSAPAAVSLVSANPTIVSTSANGIGSNKS